MHFSYEVEELKKLLREYFAWEQRSVCILTEVIWLSKVFFEEKLLKNKKVIVFVQAFRKTKEIPFMEWSRLSKLKGKNLFVWKFYVTATK